MKHNEPVPDENMYEGKPESSWAWFLATFAFVLLSAHVVFATPVVDRWIEATSDAPALVRMLPLGIFLVVVAFGVNKAYWTKYNYRKSKGILTFEDHAAHESVKTTNEWIVWLILFVVGFLVVRVIQSR